ncbi:MAG: SAM-dependent methyltransferase [Deltaproteobacteria bacterium]|nr:SAM-dependent methyltransferase [Myxococcales bacterium]MDP3216407.1 SAM-dependent methyltransferase [Deltaproteobacteria bacterium]
MKCTALTLALGLLAGCASTSPSTASTASAPMTSAAASVDLAAPDRTEADRALDRGRHPGEMLAFFRVAPGQRVADLFAGGGYTTELLARAVGPTGAVYSQNNAFVLERFARGPWTERLARPINARVVRVEREFDSPLPPEARDLDAVIFVLAYHDTVWQRADRAAMNRAIFQALRPGGVYGVIDHSAADGHGLADVETLHRIERSTLVEEVTAAGFRLDGEGDFMRNPADTRDWNDSPRAAADRRGTSDRFVLRFVRP